MSLNKTQKIALNKARVLASGVLPVTLTDSQCAYLVAVIATDLGLQAKFPQIKFPVPAFFTDLPLASLAIDGIPLLPLVERLYGEVPDAEMYFSCLASLHKRRIKYQQIVSGQLIPSMDQVGPRSLLQFGTLSPAALAGLLFWRKWIYDIDNRAAQETGYLFEPIIATSIGGVAYGDRKSPVRRSANNAKGRQVDCVLEDSKEAYEIKIRLTIAASGQGRWGEELQFPIDSVSSGYTPVLVVLDPTGNPRLDELIAVFEAQGGRAYVGERAWAHLDEKAGPTMAKFLDLYVKHPIDSLLHEAPDPLPDITFRHRRNIIEIQVGGEVLVIERAGAEPIEEGNADALPSDVDDESPGSD